MTRVPLFERFAGLAAILVGLGGLAYAALFVWIVAGSPAWVLKAWFALLLGGALLTTAVAAGLYMRLHDVEPAPDTAAGKQSRTLGSLLRAACARRLEPIGPPNPRFGQR